MSRPKPHRYDSGVYFDTYPGEAIGCCDLPKNDPVHDVACSRCGVKHHIRDSCPRSSPDCVYCGMDHPNGTACPDVYPSGTRWDQ